MSDATMRAKTTMPTGGRASTGEMPATGAHPRALGQILLRADAS